MDKFLKELNDYSKKYLTKNEVKELTSFYEEIINERLSNGELIDDILKDYDVKKIVKESLAEIIINRKDKSFKNIYQVLLLLFSTPILIPLAIIYLSFLIIFGAFFLTGLIIIISPLIIITPYIIEVFKYNSNISSILGLSSLGLIGVVIVSYIGYLFTYLSYKIAISLVKVFLNPLLKKRGNYA